MSTSSDSLSRWLCSGPGSGTVMPGRIGNVIGVPSSRPRGRAIARPPSHTTAPARPSEERRSPAPRSLVHLERRPVADVGALAVEAQLPAVGIPTVGHQDLTGAL